MGDGVDLEVDANSRIVAAHDDELERFLGIDIDFLMGHLRSKISKIAGADFCRELEALAPPDLASAFADIDRDFVRSVVMDAGSAVRLQRHGSYPSL